MLRTTLGFVGVLLLFGVANCFERGSEELVRKRGGSKTTDYKIFVLAQSWPQTSCWSLNKLWHDSQSCSRCRMPNIPNGQWTLHGLWPSNPAGAHPAHCTNVNFNPQSLGSELKKELNEKWSTFKMSMKNNQFWGYEYKKHGSCCLDNRETNTAAKYFSKSLDLLDRYNVGAALKEAHIVPGGSYDFNQIYSALKNHFGINAYLDCTHNPDTHEQYVMQVNVCFDKSFRLVDCASDKGHISSCKRSQKINYPKNLRTC